MKNLEAYYSESIINFLYQSNEEILGIINNNSISAKTTIQQINSWNQEITILKKQLSNVVNGRIIFEYTIPRMGKRVDVVILYNNIIYLLEFKCGDTVYHASTIDQVYDYALDLRNFQKESHDKLIANLIVSTNAPNKSFNIIEKERIIEPICCNSNNIFQAIESISIAYKENDFDYIAWENSEYLPTPTLIEAARALYRGHDVQEITRSDAGAKNLTATTTAINQIIAYSKKNNKKSICFITGVPGAGKTLIGLNLAIEHSD